MAEPPDQELVERLARGDRAAFDLIVARHQPRVAGLAYRLLGWPEEVDDLVQEVFLRVFTKAGSFRGEASLATWLTVLTVNLCRSHRRRQVLRWRWWQAQARQWRGPPVGPPPEAPVEGQETLAAMRQALSKLAAADREVLVLHYLEEMPLAEVAKVLNLTVSTVGVRLHRARKRLRKLLE